MIFLFWGLVAILVVAAIARVWRPKVPRLTRIVFGVGALLLAGYFVFGVDEPTPSFPEDAGIPVAFTSAVLLTGAVFFLVGVSMNGESPIAATLEVVGSLLLLGILAVPSALIVLSPIAALASVAAIGRWLDQRSGEPKAPRENALE